MMRKNTKQNTKQVPPTGTPMPIFPFKPRPTPIQQHITLPALPNAQAE